MLSKPMPLPRPHLYQTTAMQLYEDPEVVRLQGQIKILSQELADLQQAKSDIEQQIEMLHTRHHQELRPLVVELLELRRNGRRKAEEPEPPPAEPKMPPTEGEAEQDAIAASGRLARLSPAEQRAIKEMFRQASKLCHPDLVATEFKAEAGIIFIELKTAYEQYDLHRVEEILHLLERGEKLAGRPVVSRSKDKLRAEIHYLHSRLRLVGQEIEILKHSNIYKKLVNIDDWDDYFDDLKGELRRKINRLRYKKAAQPSKA
jgi:hypothetical protein